MAEYLEFISIDFWHIAMTWGNLLILVFLMKKFLFKPVNAILEKRQNQVGEIYSAAEEAQAKAQADKTEYEGKLTAVNEQAASIMKTASDRANRRSAEIIDEAQQKAAAMLQKADADLAQERKKAVNEIKDEISEMAISIAQRVLEKEIDPKRHEELIEEFISSVGEE